MGSRLRFMDRAAYRRTHIEGKGIQLKENEFGTQLVVSGPPGSPASAPSELPAEALDPQLQTL